jgi:hypothetical protein
LKKIIAIGSLIIFTSLILAACGGGAVEADTSGESASEAGEGAAVEEKAPEAKEDTLTAIRVSDGALDKDASFWNDAPILEVPTVNAEDPEALGGPTVMIQAAYDATYFYFRAEWSDATDSVLKNAWTWDGESFEKSGNEDRIMLVWPIQNNAEFASQGCGAACHNSADSTDEWYMGSDSEAVTYDAWHWKAARTNPVGYADDKWWGLQTDPDDYESSRHGDSRDGDHYANNKNENGDGPIFMSGADLTSSFIISGDEIDLDTSVLSAGDVIPGYIINRPDGSRGDIDAVGVWENGRWVVVLRRMLNTGNEDDVVFNPPKLVPFGLAIVDDGGGLPHTVGADPITLEWD